MKEQRHRVGSRTEGSAALLPPEAGRSAPRRGIPLLLLPEGVMLEVDLAMLLSDVFPAEPVLDLPEGRVTKVATRLGRAWLQQWEY
jgi:hypothetical protein